MSKSTIIGLLILLLGIGMFIFGVSMFSYSGPGLNPLVSQLGMYSFTLWGPTIIIGIIVIRIGVVASRNKRGD